MPNRQTYSSPGRSATDDRRGGSGRRTTPSWATKAAPVTQPSLFIGGALDASTTWLADAIEAYPVTLPGLVSTHLLDGCGHWIQQERPEEVNRLLTDRLAALPA